MNAPVSIKRMGLDGVSKKDMFGVDPRLLKIEPGFNLRGIDPEHVAGFETTIKAGGTIPPIDIRGTREGDLFIVDGHHRHAAIMNLINAGEDIKAVNCCSYSGSDADRVCLMFTSANGKPLDPLGQAIGVQRLLRFGWSEEQIAARIARTVFRVRQLIELSTFDESVKAMIRAGEVSADVALEMHHKHGSAASVKIAGAVDSAKSKGKNKATRAGMNGRAMPKKIVTAVISGLRNAADLVPQEARLVATMSRMDSDVDRAARTVSIPVNSLIALLDAAEQIASAENTTTTELSARKDQQ